MKPYLLITGASGFVGSNLIETLKDDFNLIEINRKPINSTATQIIWDFKSDLNAVKITKKIKAIIHLASIVGMNKGESIINYFDINTRSTLQLLELGKRIGINKFLYFSTGGIYGYKNHKITERTAPDPIDFYSITKYLSEIICHTYKEHFFIQIFRLFFPYGKTQHNRLIPYLIKCLKNNQTIKLNNNGRPRINPIYIDDLCNIIKKSLATDSSFTINVAGPEIVSIKNLAHIIAGEVNTILKFEITNNKTKDLVGDISRLKAVLQYEPQIGINEGIKRVLN